MKRIFTALFLFVSGSAFTQPALIAPANGTSVYTHTRLLWIKVPNADLYEYQISSNMNFSPTDEDLETLDTFRAVLTTLIPNSSYYWRVRARVNGDWGNFSAPWSFNVLPSGIAPPSLVSPVNNSTGVLSNPVLRWNSVPGRYQYAVVIASDINFNNVIYGRCIDTTFYEMPSDTLQLNTLYYWAVCSEDSLGFGIFSQIWNFRVRTTGVSNISVITPETFKLYNNYPNPFNPATKIKFDLPENSNVKINVFDITGRMINEIVNQNLSPGSYESEFNGANFSSGIYYYRIEAGKFIETKKMILLK